MLKTRIPYTFTKDGRFYFTKQVPDDLKQYYSKRRIVKSLQTASPKQAKLLSAVMLSRLEDYWLKLRLDNMTVPMADLLQRPSESSDGVPSIDEALALYVKTKGANKTDAYRETAQRHVRYFITAVGRKPLNQYRSSDSAAFRDYLLDKRKVSASSAIRIFSSVKSVFNFAVSELGLGIPSPFSGTYLPTTEPKRRLPISRDKIAHMQQQCLELDDDKSHLLALISETGMRLAEALGLLKEDIYLDVKTPYVEIRPHPWRRLKTTSSNRCIPLIGMSLWAAKRVAENDSVFCFPRYTDHGKCKSNAASTVLNRWMKREECGDYVVHSFRHSLRDRLRTIEAPTDLIDQIGGWSHDSIGQGYGSGYGIEHLAKALKQALDKEQALST